MRNVQMKLLKPLTVRQRNIGKALLEHIRKTGNTITYKALGNAVGLVTPDEIHYVVGNEIGEVSKYCYRLGLPLISVMVVSGDTMMCGKGFRGLCDELEICQDMNDMELQCIWTKRVLECKDWSKLEALLNGEI